MKKVLVGAGILIALLAFLVFIKQFYPTPLLNSSSRPLDKGEATSFPTQPSRLAKIQGNYFFLPPEQVSTDGPRVFFTANGKHAVYITQLTGGIDGPKALVVDDTIGPTYDFISPEIVLSLDGKRIAYRATKKGKGVVIDENIATHERKEDTRFDFVTSLVLSEDGKHLAFLGYKEGEGTALIIDGQARSWRSPAKPFGAVEISPDGSKVASITSVDANGQEMVLRIGDQTIAKYNKFKELIFSPDSKHIVFTAYRGDSLFVVRDGKEEGPYGLVGPLSFSPDSGSLAYVALLKNKGDTLIVNGRALSLPDFGEIKRAGLDLLGNRIVFSPDSKQIAYSMHQSPCTECGANSFAVAQNLTTGTASIGKVYDWVDPLSLTFSPQGKIAYVAVDTKLLINRVSFIVVGDKEQQGKYDYIGQLHFNSQGTVVGYGVKKGSEFWWEAEAVR